MNGLQTIRLLDVISFAAAAHGDQNRKYTDEPYIVHPIAVAQLLMSVTDDFDIIAAGILHDVIEDTHKTRGDIEVAFNKRIADLVFEVSDISKHDDGNREIRKEIDRAFLSIASADAKTIKLADMIDNTKTIKEHDPDFAKVYLKEMVRLLDVLKEGDSLLWETARWQCPPPSEA